jgi:hypothetical protein
MQSSPIHRGFSAGILFCGVLLAFIPASTYARQIGAPAKPRQSIVSVAPAARPQGESLARRAGDATFRNAPANYHVFSAATAGEDAGVEPILLRFAGDTRLTRIASMSKDFVLEPGGTCHEGSSYAKGDSCSLLVRFNPRGPGHRLGHLEVAHSAATDPLEVGLVGNGYAPVISFIPSEIITVPGTFASGAGTVKNAINLTVDGGDVVYIVDTGNALIKQIDPDGTILSLNSDGDADIPASLAVDSFGVFYTADTPNSSYYFTQQWPGQGAAFFNTAPSGAACTPSVPCPLRTDGMETPAELSIDANDNLFMEEPNEGAVEMPVAGADTLSFWYLTDEFAYYSGTGPATFAVDANDNLYTSWSYENPAGCAIVEESLQGAEGAPVYNKVVGNNLCGFSGDGGQARGAQIGPSVGQIAFDAAGDLYFTDSGNQRVRRIDFSTGIIHTIAGNGTTGYAGDSGPATAAELSSPSGLAVDSQGQVYILSNAPSAGPTQVLRKVGKSGMLGFGSQPDAQPTAAQTVLVTNTGNYEMTLTRAAITGANPGDFAIDPNTTTCDLTSGSTFIQSCQIGIVFTPQAAGPRTANLVLLDNTVDGADTVTLNGTGTLSTPTLKIDSPTSGQSFASGASVTFKVSVTGVSGVPAPTGAVQFKVDGVDQGSPVAVSSAAASISLTTLKSGSHTLAATYSGDANYASAGPVSESITVKAASAAPTVVELTRASAASQSCGSAAFAVTVTSHAKAAPTGRVELLDGTKLLATGTLLDGKTTLEANLKGTGTLVLTAHYAGDRDHLPANSAELKVTASGAGACKQLGAR